MAKIAYQEPYGDFRGRDSCRSGPDGQVCYRVQGRPIARRFVRPANPRSPLQRMIRYIFRNAAPAWNSLTELERASWEDPQAAITRFDAAGHQYQVVGRSLFTESFMYNVLAGRFPPSSGPNGSAWPFILSVDSIHPNSDSTELVIQFTPGSGYGAAFIYLTRALSSGTRKVPEGLFRVAARGAHNLIDLSTFPTSVSIPMDQLNHPVVSGSRVGVRLRAMTENYLLAGPDTDALLEVGPPE